MNYEKLKIEALNEVLNGVSIEDASRKYNIPLITMNALITEFELKENEELKSKSKRIRELIKNGEYEQALQLCTDDSLIILSQKITVLIKLERYEEALNLCNLEKCQNYLQIISQKITVLTKLERYDEALSICNLEKYFYNPIIAFKKITLLTRLGKFEEALNICDDEKYSKDKAIINVKQKILEMAYITHDQIFAINELLTKLYYDDISLEQINNSDINEYNKILITCAYYNKYNRNKGIKYIKSIKKNITDAKQLKNINLTYELINKKNNLFDINYYCRLLKAQINFNYQKSANNDKKIVEKKEIKKIDNTIIAKKENTNNQRKYISVVGTKVNRRSNNTNNNINIDTQNINIEKILIKDLFKDESIELGKMLYLEMYKHNNTKKALKAWDIYEAIIYKEATEENIERFINLLTRVGIETKVKKKVKI